MVLNRTDLKKLVSNCVSVVDSDDGAIQIRRFTEKQLEVYKRQNFIPGPACNAGVCFDFIYDGQSICFDFMPVAKSSRRFLSFDLYEDDRFVYTLQNFTGSAGVRKFEYTFAEKKERRVRIFLPYSCGLEIWNFNLDDGATFSPTSTEGRKRILIIGDSITHGYDSYFTSTSYAGMVATHFDAVAINQAVGGYFFCADQVTDDLDFEPDAITVAYGTNDWGRYGLDEEKYRKAAKDYIDKLCTKYPDAKIFGILPLWRQSWNQFPDKRMPFAKVYEILTEYYSAHGNVTIIDGREAVPNDVHFFTDGLHPNTVGQALYGKHVICEMEKAGFKK